MSGSVDCGVSQCLALVLPLHCTLRSSKDMIFQVSIVCSGISEGGDVQPSGTSSIYGLKTRTQQDSTLLHRLRQGLPYYISACCDILNLETDWCQRT